MYNPTVLDVAGLNLRHRQYSLLRSVGAQGFAPRNMFMEVAS